MIRRARAADAAAEQSIARKDGLVIQYKGELPRGVTRDVQSAQASCAQLDGFAIGQAGRDPRDHRGLGSMGANRAAKALLVGQVIVHMVVMMMSAEHMSELEAMPIERRKDRFHGSACINQDRRTSSLLSEQPRVGQPLRMHGALDDHGHEDDV